MLFLRVVISFLSSFAHFFYTRLGLALADLARLCARDVVSFPLETVLALWCKLRRVKKESQTERLRLDWDILFKQTPTRWLNSELELKDPGKLSYVSSAARRRFHILLAHESKLPACKCVKPEQCPFCWVRLLCIARFALLKDFLYKIATANRGLVSRPWDWPCVHSASSSLSTSHFYTVWVSCSLELQSSTLNFFAVFFFPFCVFTTSDAELPWRELQMVSESYVISAFFSCNSLMHSWLFWWLCVSLIAEQFKYVLIFSSIF